MTDIAPLTLTPTQLIGKMVDLHTAYGLGTSGYAMRSGYDAREQLQELVATMLESGQLMAFAAAYEAQQLRAKTEGHA
jgi:hypothetical protein